MLGRLLRRLFPGYVRGGEIPAYRPVTEDERLVQLSPGWVELPPGVEGNYLPEIIEQMNRGRRQ